MLSFFIYLFIFFAVLLLLFSIEILASLSILPFILLFSLFFLFFVLLVLILTVLIFAYLFVMRLLSFIFILLLFPLLMSFSIYFGFIFLLLSLPFLILLFFLSLGPSPSFLPSPRRCRLRLVSCLPLHPSLNKLHVYYAKIFLPSFPLPLRFVSLSSPFSWAHLRGNIIKHIFLSDPPRYSFTGLSEVVGRCR